MVSTSQKISFHRPEWRIRFKNEFPLDEKKNCHWQKCLKIDKKWFPLGRKSVFTNRNAFKNTFLLDQKIKLAAAGVPQNGGKKRFPLARRWVSTSRNKVIFQKLDLQVSVNKNKSILSNKKRILLQLDRKLVSTSGNGEFV